MRIGLRIWKTGLATTTTLLITSIFSILDPLLAIVAAIISLQPSVVESVKRGWSRVQATLFGALIGISLNYFHIHFFNFNLSLPILAGFGVVLSIYTFNKLKIQDGTIIGTIAVIATMVDVSDSALASGGYRTLSTLIGIVIATIVNLTLIPPQYRPTLLDEFKNVNEEIVALYRQVIANFVSCRHHQLEKTEVQVEELREKLEKVKQLLSYYKDELGYRRYLTNLSSLVVKEVVIFENSLKTLDSILDRILDIAETTNSRLNRHCGVQKINSEYGSLLKTLITMTKLVNSMQLKTINLLATYDTANAEEITEQLKEINLLKTTLHQKLNNWHITNHTEDHLLSLIEISIVAYDVQQTADYLKSLARKVIITNKKEKTSH